MLKFTGLDDLRNSEFYPKTVEALDAAKAELRVRFAERIRGLNRPPQAVVESARALESFLEDRRRRKDQDMESLAVAALHYLFGAADAIPDSVEFVGYSDDSIILDAVLSTVAGAPQASSAARAAKAKARPAARKKPAPPGSRERKKK